MKGQPDYTIKQGDTLPLLQATLTDSNGAVNLSGAASVRFRMVSADTGAVTVDALAQIADPLNGIVSYAWTPSDTSTAGEYLAEFLVTFGNGTVEHFPNDSYLWIRVVRALP
jgi:hypothetical protein